jgi:hypothetical protein
MKLTPRELEDSFRTISEESFALHQELAAIAERSGTSWLEIKAKNLTAKNGEIDKLYAATDDGKREAFLKIYLKGLGHKRTQILSEIKANNNGAW